MIMRLKLYRLFLKVGIYLLPIPAFKLGWWTWVWICQILNRQVLYSPHGHLSQVLFGTFVWALVAEHHRLTNFDEIFRERTGARASGSACVATSFVLLATLYFSRDQTFPRGLLVCDMFALLLLAIFLKAALRFLCRNRAHLAKPTRLLIVGADQFASTAAARLQRLSFARCEVAGFVRLPGQEVCVTGHRIYELEQLGALNCQHGIDEAVIAVHPAQFAQIPQVILALNHLCLPARAILDLGENIVVREKLFQLGSMQMLDLMSTPTESLDYALLKRTFDVCFSLFVLLVASPLLALIAAMIKLTSRGPVFFVQERVGLNGKTFWMYKFRTMRTSTEAESDKRWTTESDPRRTPLGAFLRKTSLDELPQFINVLNGDMSIVGPRPERPHFVHKFLQEVARYNNRHALKVGITGWAQVNGWRGNTS
ncbi:MAG: exopolysaccharide biosynthesis polyprenyl glycosylphosphotransferase, partial [Acidobacteriaceae bacterium]